MKFVRVVRRNKLFAFLVGTVLVQGSVFCGAFFLHTRHDQDHIYAHTVQALRDSSPPVTRSESVIDQNSIEEEPAAIKAVRYTVISGDTLSRIWVKNGGTVTGAILAEEALKKIGLTSRELRSGEQIEFTLSPEGDIVTMQKRMKEGRSLILRGNSQEGYSAEIAQATVIERERKVSSSIFSSFSRAAREENVPTELIDDLVDLFSGRIEFRKDLQPGDTFTMIFDERIDLAGNVLSVGPLKAASIHNGGKLLAALRHESSQGKAKYFDERGQLLGDYFLRYPVKFTRISSVFSTARFHPILKVHRPHNGVDFAAPTGTAVRSVADGTIEKAGWSGGGGITVQIRHNDRYSSAYMHLSKVAGRLRPGMRVARGDVIGSVGMTGLATAPHLHFSLYDHGKYVDPLKVSLPMSPSKDEIIPQTVLAAFMHTLEREHESVRLALLYAGSSRQNPKV